MKPVGDKYMYIFISLLFGVFFLFFSITICDFFSLLPLVTRMATRTKDEISAINGKLDAVMDTIEGLKTMNGKVDSILEKVESFQTIHSKVDAVFEKIQSLRHLLHQMNNFFINTLQKDLSFEVLNLSKTIDSKIQSVSNEINKTVKHTMAVLSTLLVTAHAKSSVA